MSLSQHQKTSIDSTISYLLEAFHTISAEYAIRALESLCKIPMMGEGQNYPKTLPEPFNDLCFSSIDEQLFMLYKMMSNRQPEATPLNQEVVGRENQHDEDFGFFNLYPEPGNIDLNFEVREYLIEQFNLRKQVIQAAPEIGKLLTNQLADEKESEFSNLYDKALFDWIAQSPHAEERMKAAIYSAVKETFSPEPAILDPKEKSALLNAIITALMAFGLEFLEETRAAIFREFLAEIQKCKGDATYANMSKKLRDYVGQPGFQAKAVLPSFVLISQAQRLIQQYRLLLQFEAKWPIDEIEQLCMRYQSHIETQPAEVLSGLDNDTVTQLDSFIKTATAHIKDARHEEIQNFFSRYFSSNSEGQEALYTKLLGYAFIENKVFINEKNLTYLTQNTSRLTSYDTNRILLTACMTPPSIWSEIFANLLQETITRLEGEGNDDSSQRVKRNSYPNTFILQLKFLLTQYAATHSEEKDETFEGEDIEEDEDVFESKFPLLYFPEGADEWGKNLSGLSPEILIVVLTTMPEQLLSDLLKKTGDLTHLIDRFSPKQCKAVLTAIPERLLSRLIPTTRNFGDFLSRLSPKQCEAVLTAIPDNLLSNLIQTKENLRDLILRLSVEKCESLLAAIPENLLSSLIRTAKDLRYIFSGLSLEKRQLIPKTVYPKLPKSIQDDFSITQAEITTDFNGLGGTMNIFAGRMMVANSNTGQQTSCSEARLGF